MKRSFAQSRQGAKKTSVIPAKAGIHPTRSQHREAIEHVLHAQRRVRAVEAEEMVDRLVALQIGQRARAIGVQGENDRAAGEERGQQAAGRACVTWLP